MELNSLGYLFGQTTFFPVYLFGQTKFFPVYLHWNKFQSLCTLLSNMLNQLCSLS